MKRAPWLTLLLLATTLTSGCVTRRYFITSDPPGALVYDVNGQPLGATPLEHDFIYYGKYRFKLVKDGYQTMTVEPVLDPPFYQWTAFEFFFENAVIFTLRDKQCFHYKLVPLVVPRPDDVARRAKEVRDQAPPIPVVPVAPKRLPPPGPVPGQLPAPTPGQVPAPGLAPPIPDQPPPNGSILPATPPPPLAPGGPVGLNVSSASWLVA